MRKGQAAMEFLMTYGWAILVVLAAIGALAYFGVLSPDNFLPSKCTLQGGFSCTDYKIDGTSDQIRFKVINNLAVDASDVNVTLVTNDCTGFAVNTLGALGNRDQAQVTFNCSNTLSGSVDAEIQVSFKRVNEDELHVVTGSITGRVE